MIEQAIQGSPLKGSKVACMGQLSKLSLAKNRGSNWFLHPQTMCHNRLVWCRAAYRKTSLDELSSKTTQIDNDTSKAV
jgi:hypothetical protein